MKREKPLPCYVDAHHQRNHDALVERWSNARMWLRSHGRIQARRSPEVPPALAGKPQLRFA